MLLIYPDKSLTNVCVDVCDFAGVNIIIEKMIDVMFINNGVGLAGPQIGVQKNIIVVDESGGENKNKLQVLINPRVLDSSTDIQEFKEGCLSIPHVYANVKRSKNINVEYLNVHAEKCVKVFTNYEAQIVQHELDHLVGKLFIDHLSSLERKLLLKHYARNKQ